MSEEDSWPKQISDVYRKALLRLRGDDSPLRFGPSHIVWEDENFDSAEWCLKHFDEYVGDYSKEELDIVRESLEELSLLLKKGGIEMSEEPITLEKFYEELGKLQSVYDNNVNDLTRVFLEKTERLFKRLLKEDQEKVQQQDREERMRQQIVLSGRSIH